MTVVATAETLSRDDCRPQTLRVMFDEHSAFVFRLLRRLGVCERDLEDATQDVFLVAHRRMAQYDGRCAPRSWLFGIARRVAVAHRRRGHVRREEPRDDIDLGLVPAAQLEDMLHAESRAILANALDQLDETKRAIFVLYELEGMTMQDIASAVDCPVQTAYSRLHVARQLVRSALERALRGRPR